MKYITVPADILVVSLNDEPILDDKGQPARLSFREFVLSRLADPSFGKDMPALLSAVQIRDAVKSANGTLALESADWARLRDATQNPSTGYNPAVAHCLLPFMSAIVGASEKAEQ